MLFKHTGGGEKGREGGWVGERDRDRERRRVQEKRKEEGERRILCSDEQFMLTALLSQKGKSVLGIKTYNVFAKYTKPTYLIIQFSGFHFKQYHSVILDFFC